jgi:hypothetical protein
LRLFLTRVGLNKPVRGQARIPRPAGSTAKTPPVFAGGACDRPGAEEKLARLRGLGQFWIARPLLINGIFGKVFTTGGDWVAGRWRCEVAAEAAN